MGLLYRVLGIAVLLCGTVISLIALAMYFSEGTRGIGIFFGILSLIVLFVGGRWYLNGKQRSGQPRSNAAFSPPTKKMLNYAAVLGLDVPDGADFHTVSKMLNAADTANPKRRRQREHIAKSQREKKYGPELLRQEQQWEALAEQDKWLVAVYKSGKNIKTELLRINGASLQDKGGLRVHTEVAKVVNDRDVGCEQVDLGRDMDLNPEQLLWSAVIDEIDCDDVDHFRATLAEAEKQTQRVARELAR